LHTRSQRKAPNGRVGSISVSYPGLDDELDESRILEVGDRLGGVSLDVSIEQEPHAGLVLLEVDLLAGAELDLVAHGRVMGDLGLDRGRLGTAVAGIDQLVGDIAVGRGLHSLARTACPHN
jgi:hypothetical protein